MKPYITLVAVAVTGLLSFSSCKDTLDTHPTSSFDEETVWGSKNTADAFVLGTYAAITFSDGWQNGCSWWESRGPNSQHFNGGNPDGFVTELSLSSASDYGINRFGALRRCNLIIQKATESDAFSESEKAELIAHARFLRGYIFFDQTRKMGRFLPVLEVLTEADSLKANIPMTKSIAESYSYVMADFEAAITDMPVSAKAGIANKYLVEVIYSRACLQAYAYTGDESYLDKAINAATDVINHGSLSNNYYGLFNETDAYNPEILWGFYRLAANTTVVDYTEMINVYPNVKMDDMLDAGCPTIMKCASGAPTFEGWMEHQPTQDFVDNYLVIDEATGEAKLWYETTQFKNAVELHDPMSVTEPGQIDSYTTAGGKLRRMPTAQDFNQLNPAYPSATMYGTLKAGSSRDISDIMYGNRDLRMDGTIVRDKSTWYDEYVETNMRGNLSKAVRLPDGEDGGNMISVTSYYWRKNAPDKISPRANSASPTDFHICMARVGEAYMNLAEAYLLKGRIAEAVAALNKTRTVHGGLSESKASSAEEAWADYIRERTVEMVVENGDLYFSYLRWGKYGGHANHGRAPGDIVYELDHPVYKMEINQARTAFLINQVTLGNTAQRTFTQRRYLLPIPDSFRDTRAAYSLDNEQNPGW